MKPKHRWLVIIGLVWLAACIGLLGFALYRNTNEKVLDAYALDWTATLITEHLDRHQGAWPRSWDELAATAEQVRQETPATDVTSSPAAVSEEIQRVRKRVRVDFEAKPHELLAKAGEAESPPWEVVSLRAGRVSQYQSRDPNTVILDHLRTQAGSHGGR